jgi:hypothetical protein
LKSPRESPKLSLGPFLFVASLLPLRGAAIAVRSYRRVWFESMHSIAQRKSPWAKLDLAHEQIGGNCLLGTTTTTRRVNASAVHIHQNLSTAIHAKHMRPRTSTLTTKNIPTASLALACFTCTGLDFAFAVDTCSWILIFHRCFLSLSCRPTFLTALPENPLAIFSNFFLFPFAIISKANKAYCLYPLDVACT